MKTFELIKGLHVSINPEERNRCDLLLDDNCDWSACVNQAWQRLLSQEEVIVCSERVDTALKFAQLFLQTMGYTPERAARETKDVFELEDLPQIPPEHVEPQESLGYYFMRFKKIVETLRKKCPWDREVTPYQLVTLSREELSELMAAIESNDSENYAEELGDLWLHLLLHTTIAEESQAFDLNTVFRMASEKAVSRHPHVFASDHDSDAATVLSKWQERKGKSKDDNTVPPDVFTWALRLQDEAHHYGLDWSDPMELESKLNEEFAELSKAYASQNKDEINEEVGDLLFTVVNLARLLNVDPEDALLKASRKFQRRLSYVSERRSMKDVNELWEESKNEVG
jgi:MazG family protein